MMRNLLLTTALLLTLLLGFMPAAGYAYDPFGDTCSNPAPDVQNSSLCQGDTKSNPAQNPLTGKNGLIRRIANVIAVLAGISAVIIIIIAGLRYITSGGDAAKVKGAKDAIIAALIGIVIIVLADVIIGFVISRV